MMKAIKFICVLAIALVTIYSCNEHTNASKNIAQNKVSKDKGVKWHKNVDGHTFAEIKKLSKNQNKPIFLDFYTKWCGPCRVMDKNVFSTKEVGDFYNKNFINFKIDAEAGEGVDIKKQYGVREYPTYIFVDHTGKIVREEIITSGRGSVEDMIELGEVILGKEEKSWTEYEKEYKEGNRSTAFLKEYMYVYGRTHSKRPTEEMIEEWINSIPKDQLLENKDAKNTIFMRALPGTNYYNMLLENKDKFDQLNDREQFMKWTSNVLRRSKYKKLDVNEVKVKLNKDFPKYTQVAYDYYDLDQLRFQGVSDSLFMTKYFKFIDDHDLPVTLNVFIPLRIIKLDKIPESYANKMIPHFEKTLDYEYPHYLSFATYAYILAKSGQFEKAQEFALKNKELTKEYKGNKKLGWAYKTMKNLEEGKLPKKANN